MRNEHEANEALALFESSRIELIQHDNHTHKAFVGGAHGESEQ